MSYRTGAQKLSAPDFVRQAVARAGTPDVHQRVGGRAGSGDGGIGLSEHAAPLIAITGATGFIGSNLCFRLRASGFRVRALIRSPGRAQSLARAGIDILPGDLASPPALRQLLAGSAAVIHCAGTVRGRTPADFASANVLGSQQLVQAIQDSDTAPRLLAMSSLAAREPQLSPYAASKLAGERVVTASGDSVAWTILRPPAVYGPGDRELLPLFRLMARGIALLPGCATDRVSMLYIDDLTTAVMRWLAVDWPPRRIFTLSDPTDAGYSWSEIIRIAGVVCGRRVRSVRVPSVVLDGIAGVNWAAAALLRHAPMLTPGKVRELRHSDWTCDWRELGAALDWQPRVDLATGMRNTLHDDDGR
ncbi:MAG: NAD(P)-dependent oxidoreductase [Porticoccaceae bacterium]|nr:MAG: NAD(P)-dependent oxidoreductase [Porticoccaceae bacterium]